jgi:hypothetical protein
MFSPVQCNAQKLKQHKNALSGQWHRCEWIEKSCPYAQLIKHYTMKSYWESGSIAPPFLTSALDDWSEWSAHAPSCFTHEKRAPGTQGIGSWVGPGASLDTTELRKISCPCHELNHGVQPTTCCYTDWATPAPDKCYGILQKYSGVYCKQIATEPSNIPEILLRQWEAQGTPVLIYYPSTNFIKYCLCSILHIETQKLHN